MVWSWWLCLCVSGFEFAGPLKVPASKSVVRIEEASELDLPVAATLLVESFFPFQSSTFVSIASHREHERLLRAHGRVMQLAARRSGEVVGFLSLDFDHVLKPYVSDLAVRCDARRRGIAGELLERCEHFVRERNESRLNLRVESHNVPAMEMYERYGFVVRPSLPGDEDKITYTKLLE